MAAEKKFPISLIVKAIDQASGPLTAMTASLKSQLGPFNDLSDKWSKFGKAANFGAVANVGTALRDVGSEVLNLGARIGGLALGAGVAFGAVIRSAEQAGSRLEDTARRVGLTVDVFASLEFAAKRSGVENEAFASGMDKLNKQLGDMTVGKGGEFLKFLNEIGPGFAKQMKGAKGVEEAMALLTDAFARIDDPQRRATLAAHAFGKTNLQMGEFLNQGSDAVQALQRRYFELAGSQEGFATRAGVMGDAFDDLEVSTLGLRNAFAAGLFPALTRLSNAATEFLAKNREGIAAWAERTGAKIEAWVDGGGMTRLADNLGKVADGAGKVVDFLGPLGVAVAAGAVLFAPLILSVGSLGLALVTATPALIAFGGLLLPLAPAIIAVTGAGAALAVVGYEIYSAWDDVNAKIEEFGDTLRWAVVDGWAEVRPVIAAMSVLPGFGAALAAGDFVAGQASQAIEKHTGQSVEAIRARAAGGLADDARPRPITIGGQSLVSVRFDNLPAGTRVSQSGDAPADLSVGYSVMP